MYSIDKLLACRWENFLPLGTRRRNSGDLHEPTALQTRMSMSKLSKWSLTFGPWDAMLSSHPFRSDPTASVHRNVKEFYSRPLITCPPPHRMNRERKHQWKDLWVAGFICISTQKQAICQSLNCLIKYLYIEEGMVRNAFFGPSFLSFSLGVSFFLHFTPSLWPSGFPSDFGNVGSFNVITNVGGNLILGIIVLVRELLFQKQIVLCTWFTAHKKHSLISQALPPRAGVESGARPGGPLGPAVSLAYPSLPTALCDPVGCSLPGSSVHGILQARMQEWDAISLSRGSYRPRDWVLVSCVTGRSFTFWATREAPQNCFILINPINKI